MASQICLGTGISEIVPFSPSFAQVFEYALHMDPEGFLRYMAAGAADTRLEDLLESYAASEAEKIQEYFAVCAFWRSR